VVSSVDILNARILVVDDKEANVRPDLYRVKVALPSSGDE
jgi:uncharacterized membrane protein